MYKCVFVCVVYILSRTHNTRTHGQKPFEDVLCEFVHTQHKHNNNERKIKTTRYKYRMKTTTTRTNTLAEHFHWKAGL